MLFGLFKAHPHEHGRAHSRESIGGACAMPVRTTAAMYELRDLTLDADGAGVVTVDRLGATAVVTIVEPMLDNAAVMILARALDACVSGPLGHPNLVIDLSDVAHVEPGALGRLAEALENAASAARVALVVDPFRVNSVFGTHRPDRFAHVRRSVPEAIALLERAAA